MRIKLLPAILEKALIEQLRATRAHQWREANREPIAAYNALIDEQGTFSAGIQTF